MPRLDRALDHLFVLRARLLTIARRRLSVTQEAETILLEREIAPLLRASVHGTPGAREETKRRMLAQYEQVMRDQVGNTTERGRGDS